MALSLRKGVYHWRKEIEGIPFQRSTRTGDLKTAEMLAVLWEAEAIKDVLIKGTKPVTVHAVIDAFLQSRKGTAGYRNAEIHLRHFRALPNVKMDMLTLHQVQSVINKRRDAGISINTLSVSVAYWNAVVKHAVDQKWTSGPKLPRIEAEQTRLRYLSLEEEAQLFAELDYKDSYPGKNAEKDAQRANNFDLMLFLCHVGCRFSEAAHAKWQQVDLKAKTLLVIRNKRGVDNTLVLSDKVYEMLKRRKAEATTEWIFPTKRVSNNNSSWIKSAMRRAGVNADLGKVTLHTARHTYASRMINSGMNITEVQALLGHRQISSTLVYAHLETGVVAHKAAQVLNASADT